MIMNLKRHAITSGKIWFSSALLGICCLWLISCNSQEENSLVLLKIDAQQIAQSNLDTLKVVDTSQVKILLNTYDNLFEWEDIYKIIATDLPSSYLRSNLAYEKQKYIQEYQTIHKFYYYPITLENQRYNCLLITTKNEYENWMGMGNMYEMNLFYLPPTNSSLKPVLLAKHLRALVTVEYRLNTTCFFYSNNTVLSKFNSSSCSDVIIDDKVSCYSDTVFVKMKFDKMVLKELKRDTLKTEYEI